MIAGAGLLRRARPGFSCVLLVMVVVGASAAPAAENGPLLIDDYREITEHLIGEQPRVVTPWVDYTLDHDNGWWHFDLAVDENGLVTTAKLEDGVRMYREQAQSAVEAVRFKPFVRDGRAVPVHVEFSIYSRPDDYAGPIDRAFPQQVDPSTLVISLSRSNCLGTCPTYRVELRGNGEVSYYGDDYVVVPGRHRWRVDPAKIAPLLELFRKANYFKLDGFYMYPATDLPTYVTRLSVGERSKFVLNYGGSFGEAAASVRTEGADPNMPPIVMEIENAIDEVSGAKSLVDGDENTMERLREERFNFRSRDAGNGLRMLLSDCKTRLAREFVEAGAPVNVTGDGYVDSGAIIYAAHCADLELVKLLAARGALKRRSDAKSFLWSSAGSGDGDMVALALKHYRNANIKDEEGTPLINHAAGSYANDDAPNAARFDWVKVIDLLIAAGADPDARDEDGNTALFEANEPQTVTALIRHGADPNARNKRGETPLFDEYFEETKAALLASGADVNLRSVSGRTALFEQPDAEVIRMYLEAGADINAADSQGHTAIEEMNSREAVLALLKAGAKLPAHPARLSAMIATATKKEWPDVVGLLTAATK